MTIPVSVRFDILERDQFTCRFCGKRAPETELEVDHIHPRSKGGSDATDNLVTACRDCNRGKGDRRVDLTHTDWGQLVGKFFHSRDPDGYVRWQGRVAAEVQPGYFMVECFEWFTGSFGSRSVVPLTQMVEERWVWYRTDEDMRYAHRYAIGGIRERPITERNGHEDEDEALEAVELTGI